MFTFQKRSGTDRLLQKNFNHLYEFTDEQKKAILLSLFEIANCDGEFHQLEIAYFKRTSNLLGFSIKNGKLKKWLDRNKEHFYSILRKLSESQKDWYVFTVLGMVYSDSTVDEREYNHVNKFLLSLGFSPERIKRNMVNPELLNDSE